MIQHDWKTLYYSDRMAAPDGLKAPSARGRNAAVGRGTAQKDVFPTLRAGTLQQRLKNLLFISSTISKLGTVRL